MTTKPKTRKAPAAKAEASWPIENRYDKNFSSNDIPKLIARWRFLEADRQYHAAVADHMELAKVAMGRHREERNEIVERLAKMVPDNFDDASALLEFFNRDINPRIGRI